MIQKPQSAGGLIVLSKKTNMERLSQLRGAIGKQGAVFLRNACGIFYRNNHALQK
jgi:hypothetical protein